MTTVSRNAGRTTRRHRELARQLRSERRPCALCGQPIDYTLRFPHPWAFTADHQLSKRDRPDLVEDFGNYQAAHFRCNNTKGPDQAGPGLGTTADDW